MNMTRPRIRLAEGKDPTAAIDRIYGASQLDFPKGNVRVNRDGEMVGGPVGFTDIGPDYQKPQDPIDRHGKSYDSDTGHEWQHDGGDRRPDFDKGHHFKEARGLKAAGRDASRSPFSAAHFKGRGEGYG